MDIPKRKSVAEEIRRYQLRRMEQKAVVAKKGCAAYPSKWLWQLAKVAAILLSVCSLHYVVADYLIPLNYIPESSANHELKLTFVNGVHSPKNLEGIFLGHKNLLQEQWNKTNHGISERCTRLMHQLADRMDKDRRRLGEYGTVPPPSSSDPFIEEGCIRKMKHQVLDLQSFVNEFADHLARAERDIWIMVCKAIHLVLKCARSTWQEKVQTIAFFILWHHEMWISLPEVQGLTLYKTFEMVMKAMGSPPIILGIPFIILKAAEIVVFVVAAQLNPANVVATTTGTSLSITREDTKKAFAMVTGTCSIFLWMHVREHYTPFVIDMLVKRGWSGDLNAPFFWIRATFLHVFPMFVKETCPGFWDVLVLISDCAVQYLYLFSAENALFNLRVLAKQNAGVA